jgi:hypothetical protein
MNITKPIDTPDGTFGLPFSLAVVFVTPQKSFRYGNGFTWLVIIIVNVFLGGFDKWPWHEQLGFPRIRTLPIGG